MSTHGIQHENMEHFHRRKGKRIATSYNNNNNNNEGRHTHKKGKRSFKIKISIPYNVNQFKSSLYRMDGQPTQVNTLPTPFLRNSRKIL